MNNKKINKTQIQQLIFAAVMGFDLKAVGTEEALDSLTIEKIELGEMIEKVIEIQKSIGLAETLKREKNLLKLLAKKISKIKVKSEEISEQEKKEIIGIIEFLENILELGKNKLKLAIEKKELLAIEKKELLAIEKK